MFGSSTDIRASGTDRGAIIGVWTTLLGWLALVAVFIGLTPALSSACACGCGVFEVGTAALYPEGSGGTVWFEYDFMDQYLNWHAAHIASAGANSDKVIRTHFLNLGAQYMLNRDWGVQLEVPYWYRYFKTTGDNGQIQGFNFNSIGDVRLAGMYTGLAEDMSTGLLGGVKLPTGDYTYPHADRDTEIGTGSTDLLFGLYHVGILPFSLKDHPFNWFGQLNYELPVFTQDHYKPGREIDGALGSYYNIGGWSFLKELAPMLAILYSDRVRDSLSQADPRNSGSTRFLIAPGAEIRVGGLRFYGDVEFPLFQNMNGNQLTTPYQFKTIVSYDF